MSNRAESSSLFSKIKSRLRRLLSDARKEKIDALSQTAEGSGLAVGDGVEESALDILKMQLSAIEAELGTNSGGGALLRDSRLTHWIYVRDSDQPHHSFFGYFKRLSHLPVTFIDIGANTGISALSLHKMCPKWPIISFEPLEILTPMLRLTQKHLDEAGGDFRYLTKGLGDKRQEVKMVVPVIDGAYYDTLASVATGQFDKGYIKDLLGEVGCAEEWNGDVVESEVEIFPLDEIDLDIRTPYLFIKIDAEGFEASVLRGMAETVKKYRPGFVIECDSHEIFEILADWGYSHEFQYFDPKSNGLKDGLSDEAEGNFFFFPPESPLCLQSERDSAIAGDGDPDGGRSSTHKEDAS